MKVAHLSDLHFGKMLHNFSLIEDQKYIISQIQNILIEQKVQIVMICGDIYDKNIASIEAIHLFEDFLQFLVDNNIQILIISGNHDSQDRLTFGRAFMKKSGIHFSKCFDGSVSSVTLNDEFGPLNFYLLPFIKPIDVRHIYPDEEINLYEAAVKCVLKNIKLNLQERNVILCHQNILNAEHCDSEDVVIGSLDAIASSVFSNFDYTALGHIHKPQFIGQDNKIRFCGTPLKYSISEMDDEKSVTVINFLEKGKTDFEFIPLKPLREIRRITGKFEDIINNVKNDLYNKEDFIDIVLQDEIEVTDAIYKLRLVYKNILQIGYDNSRTKSDSSIQELHKIQTADPVQLFDEFYQNRNGIKMNDEQTEYIKSLVEKIWEKSE